MNKKLSSNYWDQRYQQGDTPWNMGQVSPPIQHYVDQIPNKELLILIPGAGHAHEAIYLHQQGFSNVYVCDWADTAFDWLRHQAPNFPSQHMLVQNFFDLDTKVDLILEQTFFCAIAPSLRPQYVSKTASILNQNGKLAGLFWNHQFPSGPPFGGDLEEYQQLFSPYFNLLQQEVSPYSITPRAGRELFLELQIR